LFLEAVGYGIVAPTLPFISREMGATDLQNGSLFGLYALVGIVGVLPLGLLADRLGRRILIYVGLGALSISSLGYVHAPNLPLLFVARGFQGLGGNAVWVGCIAMQGDLAGRGEMARRLSWLTAAWSLGFLIGPALGGLGSPRTPFYLYAAVSALALAYCVAWLPETFRGDATFGVDKLRRILALPQLRVSGTVVFLLALFYGAFEAFIPTFLTDRGASRASVALFFCMLARPTLFLPQLAGRLADSLGDRRILRVTLPAWCLLVGGSVFLLESLSPALTFFALGMAEVAIYVPGVAVLHRGITNQDRGGASSANNFLFSLGFILGPVATGAVLESVGHRGVFLAVGAIGLAGAWLVGRTLANL
ncbi:MAG: MFS transporter, partial [Gemmatimonadales bacterium]